MSHSTECGRPPGYGRQRPTPRREMAHDGGVADDISLAELAEQFFQTWGDRPALWYDGRWWRSAELRDRTMTWATGLREECGVQPGDRVVVMMANSPEVGIAYQAIWRLGAVVTPVVFLLAGAELAHVLHDSGAVAVITSPEFQATVVGACAGSDVRTVVVVDPKDLPTGTTGPRLLAADVLEECAPEPAIVHRGGTDLAALLYTGGTTGRAKGVMLTHTGLVAAGRAGAEVSYVPGANRSLIPLPLSHAYGLLLACIGLASKEPSEVILMRWFDPQGFLQLAQDHQVHRAAVVPSMLAMVLNQQLEDFDLTSLRFVSSGGAPLAPRLQAAFEKRLPQVRVIEGYGMTETSGLSTTSHPDTRRVGTVGRAAPGYEVRIADPETDRVLGPDEPGEVQVRGDGVMAGYWHASDATEAVLRGGWLHTGDVGILDSDGYLRIVDRLKDLIIRGGFNIYPRDIEDALLEHPQVALAAVVGRPDDIYGEEVIGFVSLTPGSSITGPELVTWARTQIAANKYPREINVVDAIPLTSVGKLDRKALRAGLIHPAG